jgi:hypothetical protein
VLHIGAASPGVRQKPPEQMMASVQVQQSALLVQTVRQAPFTHIWPTLHAAFEWQLGCGRSFGSHRPSLQRSCGPQSVSTMQPPWQ